MALPIRDYVALQAVEEAIQKSKILRDNVNRWKSKIDATPTTGDVIINAAQGIKQIRNTLAALALVSGLNDAAKSQYNDQALVMTAELNSIVSACDSCLSWIASEYPKDASGYLLDRKLVDGVIVDRTFSVVALAGLSAQFSLLLSSFS